MKTLFKAISIAGILLGGIASTNPTQFTKVPGIGSGIARKIFDEDPIIMHGHVKNPSGNGIANASVKLRLPGTSTPLYSATTDGAGDYEIDSINANTYGIKISATGYQNLSDTLTISTSFERTDTLVAQ